MTKAYLAIGNEVKACCEVGEMYEIKRPLYSKPAIAMHMMVREDFERNLINKKNDESNMYRKDINKLWKQGYTDQPYAIEFKQVEEVDYRIGRNCEIKKRVYTYYGRQIVNSQPKYGIYICEPKTTNRAILISVTQQQYDNIKNGGYLFMRKIPKVWR